MFNPPMTGSAYVTPTSGAAFGPSNYYRRIPCPHNNYTSNMGNSQQLPNGNTLICVALKDSIFELDSLGNLLWYYGNTIGGGPGPNAIPQASRYTACYISGTQPHTPTISQNGDVLTCDSAGTSYQWYLNGGAIIGATTQTYTVTQSGNYQVKIVDATNCGSSLSSTISVTASGISIVDSDLYWRIYPNPSADKIFLQTHQPLVNYSIMNINGSVIKSVSNWNTNNSISIDNLEKGLYMIQLKSVDNTKHYGTFKFSKI